MHDPFLQQRLAEIIERHGPWTAHNIQLDAQTFTMMRTDEPISRVRARQYLRTVADTLRVPFSELRVLDLACLEGGFGIEFGAQGAEVVGIDAREANIAKAEFARDALGLSRVTFAVDDVRNLSPERYGMFDVVLCLGIFYHLDAPDLLPFLKAIASVCTKLCILDTHISLKPLQSFVAQGETYHGRIFPEHHLSSSMEERHKKLWASLDNTQSFWLTEASLLNALSLNGFTSVFECLHPSVITTPPDRKMFAALKGSEAAVRVMSPYAKPFLYEFHHYEIGDDPHATGPTLKD